jgi:signal transduction histidine kinase
MTFGRPLFFNHIGGQMAILILISLLAIHAVIAASFFFGHRGESWGPPDEGPAQFVALVRLANTTKPTERADLLAVMAQTFPRMEIKPAAAMPIAVDHTDPRLRHLGDRLGPGFELVKLPAATPSAAAEGLAVAVKLPDGEILTARLPPRLQPPFLGGPIASTILFVIVSVSLLGIWATRALHRPLSGFAKAAEGFSVDGDVAKLPECGPEEIRAVAKAFNRMSDRVKALVGDRTRMLAAMGHDLRTPITRLRLRSEFIGDSDLRGQMLRDLDQMNAMTEDVLVFLRDGQTRETVTAVDVASSLQTICDQFTDLGHDVQYQGPDHATLTARPDDLRRAVANLVDNAVRYGTHVMVRLTSDNAELCIAVEDDGPGIIDASKVAMLEPFVRGDARTMDDRAGFGLGLAIARTVAEAHGGTLTLHDRAPHGLAARIALPAIRFDAAKVA